MLWWSASLHLGNFLCHGNLLSCWSWLELKFHKMNVAYSMLSSNRLHVCGDFSLLARAKGWVEMLDGLSNVRSTEQGGSVGTHYNLQCLSPDWVVLTWKPRHTRDNEKRQEGGEGGGGLLFKKRGKELGTWFVCETALVARNKEQKQLSGCDAGVWSKHKAAHWAGNAVLPQPWNLRVWGSRFSFLPIWRMEQDTAHGKFCWTDLFMWGKE